MRRGAWGRHWPVVGACRERLSEECSSRREAWEHDGRLLGSAWRHVQQGESAWWCDSGWLLVSAWLLASAWGHEHRVGSAWLLASARGHEHLVVPAWWHGELLVSARGQVLASKWQRWSELACPVREGSERDMRAGSSSWLLPWVGRVPSTSPLATVLATRVAVIARLALTPLTLAALLVTVTVACGATSLACDRSACSGVRGGKMGGSGVGLRRRSTCTTGTTGAVAGGGSGCCGDESVGAGGL